MAPSVNIIREEVEVQIVVFTFARWFIQWHISDGHQRLLPPYIKIGTLEQSVWNIKKDGPVKRAEWGWVLAVGRPLTGAVSCGADES